MSNLDKNEVKDAWENVTNRLAVSEKRLTKDIASITDIWANSSGAIKDDLPSAMQRLASLVCGYIIGTQHDEILYDVDVQADLTILIIDFVSFIMEFDDNRLKDLRLNYGVLDGDKMLEAWSGERIR